MVNIKYYNDCCNSTAYVDVNINTVLHAVQTDSLNSYLLGMLLLTRCSSPPARADKQKKKKKLDPSWAGNNSETGCAWT